MTKSELRNIYKQKRAYLTDELRDSYSLQIANHLLKLPIWDKKVYHTFLPIEKFNEINTEYILNILFGKDKDVVIPKTIVPECKLKHYLLTDQTHIAPNNWGIPEPTDGIEVPLSCIEVVFVPLLAFDEKGNRVGYGKGFYDIFLSQCQAIKIGLSFFCAEKQISDIAPTDVGLDYCVTPEKIYQF